MALYNNFELDFENVIRRLERLETQDPSYIFDVNLPQAEEYTYQLNDLEFGERFNAKDDTSPTDWDSSDTASLSEQREESNSWHIHASSANQTFEYQKQFSIDSGDYAGAFSSVFQDISLRGFLYSSNVTYYIGIYANNAGAFSTNDFVRAQITWNSSTNVWEARAQIRTAGVDSTGSYYPIGFLPPAKLSVRCYLSNIAGGVSTVQRVYLGSNNRFNGQQLLLQSAGTKANFQNPWLRISANHGTDANTSVFSIESVDFQTSS